ncbi:HlyD family type I secretion periplasmic adaptor subunit [Jiella avicenniae]|uniref:Membrane fusion protein (MFP) family protein n=1 Tax=Jiella avicenniae TaxID=2907202 RepID=A0A9X1P1E9_9HYPH|nr:HlyD family type I secretion periplasmic adaptor subunit [Jiella avicenniae]MCE7029625.1 HlyD family type I secretion periplasmic adaptor subunit [Jiella avicenniae]
MAKDTGGVATLGDGKKPRASWTSEVPSGTRLHTFTGLFLGVAFLGSFAAWASLAPIAGAAVAPGVVAAAGQNLSIQHLEGGIVQAIAVAEGERVSEGQPLVELDPTVATAERDRLKNQLIGLEARAARLSAERDGAGELVFDAELVQRARTSAVVDLLDEQHREFAARLARHRQEQEIMVQQIKALQEQAEGMTAQKTALERQIQVVREEEARKGDLLGKGLTNRSEYTALVRAEADLVGQLGQVVSTILASNTQITQAEQEAARLEAQRVETAVSQLNDVRASLSDMTEQLRASESVLSRSVIRSPADGVIVAKSINTIGSVVKPGETLIEILPSAADLIVEVRLSPNNIDSIRPGQGARLRFTSLNARTTPTAEATVSYVSADRLVDRQNRESYYTARLKLDEPLPPGLSAESITPGMPVEAYIFTGERSFFDYLTQPITDSFARAFRE